MVVESNIGRLEWIAKGWKRGAFVPLALNEDLLKELPEKLVSFIRGRGEDAYLIPILYDCALIEDCFDKEPWAQVVVAWRVEKDGNYMHARNPRKLHFQVFLNKEPVFLEVTALFGNHPIFNSSWQ